jgi:hypothetical protein
LCEAATAAAFVDMPADPFGTWIVGGANWCWSGGGRSRSSAGMSCVRGGNGATRPSFPRHPRIAVLLLSGGPRPHGGMRSHSAHRGCGVQCHLTPRILSGEVSVALRDEPSTCGVGAGCDRMKAWGLVGRCWCRPGPPLPGLAKGRG